MSLGTRVRLTSAGRDEGRMSDQRPTMEQLNERAWEFIERIAEGNDICDCECWHDEGEPCTTDCTVCLWCEATELVVERNKERERV